jgi:hypothetical protein
VADQFVIGIPLQEIDSKEIATTWNATTAVVGHGGLLSVSTFVDDHITFGGIRCAIPPYAGFHPTVIGDALLTNADDTHYMSPDRTIRLLLSGSFAASSCQLRSA